MADRSKNIGVLVEGQGERLVVGEVQIEGYLATEIRNGGDGDKRIGRKLCFAGVEHRSGRGRLDDTKGRAFWQG